MPAIPHPISAPSDAARVEVVLPGVVDADGLIVRRAIPLPLPAGRVRVRMEATGVSFAEQQMRRGRYYDQPAFPFVPGYDVVGRVEAVAPDVDDALIGRRVAAITKLGAWASIVDVHARAVLPVDDDLDAAAVETLVVNGVTAWRMLHDVAGVRAGDTVVVLGANGGVGSTLVQLARAAGARVLGTAAPRHRERVAELGAEHVDATGPQVHDRLAAAAPGGVDAVFDHVGGPGLVRSFALLRRGGTLVSYGTAATRDDRGAARAPVLLLLARLAAWNALPNGRRARFFDLWAGRRMRPAAFHAAQRRAFATTLALLRSGDLAPQVAARIPLSRAAEALALAESRTVAGKVVIVPDPIPAAG